MKMRKELNNKGFSLVELLIATTILGIVVVPLLHSFVVSAQTAARSGKLGDAVLASENIMEGMEGVDVSDLVYASEIGSYIPGASGQQLYKLVDGAYTALGADATPSAPYHLGMEIQAGGSVFDAMVTFNPDVYSTADDDGLNDLLLADYSNMDAAFVQTHDGNDPDVLARALFEQEANDEHGLLWDEVSVETFRTLTLTIDEYEETEGEETGGPVEKITARLELNYSYTYRYIQETQATPESPIETTVKDGQIDIGPIEYPLIPHGFSVAGNNLPNLYLMYYPLYEKDSHTNDTIRIYNEVALPFKIFLVKQRGDDLSGELQYHARVEQYVPEGTGRSNYAVIYSNIREDLSNRNNPVKLANVVYKVYRGSYMSENGVFGGTEGDLVSKSARDRIFEATVTIYDSVDGAFENPIHTIQSTKLQ